MNSINQLPSKAYPVKGVIRPQSLAAAASVSTGYIDAADGLAFARAIVNAGLIATTGSISVKVEQAKDAAGTDVKDLLTAADLGLAAKTTDNATHEFEFRPHEILDLDNGFTHFRVTVSAADDAALVAAEVQYGPARYQS